jgi:RNA polymerase sigma-70 factor (ECF subfamily)
MQQGMARLVESVLSMGSVIESSVVLLDRARAGDDRALGALLSRYLPRLRRWASGRLPISARGLLDTEDVVQDTLIRTLRNLDRLSVGTDGTLQAYLRQAIQNRLTDLYRQGRVRPGAAVLSSDLPAPEPSPLEVAIGGEALARYERALARLTSDDREAVILRIEFQHPYDEIASMLGKSSAASARMAVSRALARLSKEMQHA